ncbi:MAG: hypothetical protein SNJ57_17080 [Cyanobacteriota bacterium]
MADRRSQQFGAGQAYILGKQFDIHGIQLEQRNGETVLLDPMGRRAGIQPIGQIIGSLMCLGIGLFSLMLAMTGIGPGWVSLLLQGLFFVLGPLAILGSIAGVWFTIVSLQMLQRAEPAELCISPYPTHPGDWVTIQFQRRFKTASGSNPGKLSAIAFGLNVQKDNSEPPPTYRATPIWVENLPEKEFPSGLMQVEHTWRFCLPPDAAPTYKESSRSYRTHFITWGVCVRLEIPGFLINQSTFFFLVEPQT